MEPNGGDCSFKQSDKTRNPQVTDLWANGRRR